MAACTQQGKTLEELTLDELKAVSQLFDEDVYEAINLENCMALRKSYGGSHIVMSCKQLRGDMNYAWPTAEIAVMGGAGAVEVLYAKEAKAAEDPKAVLAEKEAEYNKLFCNPYNAAKYGYIDDVIEPRNTRFRVIRALQQLATKKVVNPAKKHGNIPL